MDKTADPVTIEIRTITNFNQDDKVDINYKKLIVRTL